MADTSLVVIEKGIKKVKEAKDEHGMEARHLGTQKAVLESDACGARSILSSSFLTVEGTYENKQSQSQSSTSVTAGVASVTAGKSKIRAAAVATQKLAFTSATIGGSANTLLASFVKLPPLDAFGLRPAGRLSGALSEAEKPMFGPIAKADRDPECIAGNHCFEDVDDPRLLWVVFSTAVSAAKTTASTSSSASSSSSSSNLGVYSKSSSASSMSYRARLHLCAADASYDVVVPLCIFCRAVKGPHPPHKTLHAQADALHAAVSSTLTGKSSQSALDHVLSQIGCTNFLQSSSQSDFLLSLQS